MKSTSNFFKICNNYVLKKHVAFVPVDDPLFDSESSKFIDNLLKLGILYGDRLRLANPNVLSKFLSFYSRYESFNLAADRAFVEPVDAGSAAEATSSSSLPSKTVANFQEAELRFKKHHQFSVGDAFTNLLNEDFDAILVHVKSFIDTYFSKEKGFMLSMEYTIQDLYNDLTNNRELRQFLEKNDLLIVLNVLCPDVDSPPTVKLDETFTIDSFNTSGSMSLFDTMGELGKLSKYAGMNRFQIFKQLTADPATKYNFFFRMALKAPEQILPFIDFEINQLKPKSKSCESLKLLINIFLPIISMYEVQARVCISSTEILIKHCLANHKKIFLMSFIEAGISIDCIKTISTDDKEKIKDHMTCDNLNLAMVWAPDDVAKCFYTHCNQGMISGISDARRNEKLSPFYFALSLGMTTLVDYFINKLNITGSPKMPFNLSDFVQLYIEGYDLDIELLFSNLKKLEGVYYVNCNMEVSEEVEKGVFKKRLVPILVAILLSYEKYPIDFILDFIEHLHEKKQLKSILNNVLDGNSLLIRFVANIKFIDSSADAIENAVKIADQLIQKGASSTYRNHHQKQPIDYVPDGFDTLKEVLDPNKSYSADSEAADADAGFKADETHKNNPQKNKNNKKKGKKNKKKK